MLGTNVKASRDTNSISNGTGGTAVKPRALGWRLAMRNTFNRGCESMDPTKRIGDEKIESGDTTAGVTMLYGIVCGSCFTTPCTL